MQVKVAMRCAAYLLESVKSKTKQKLTIPNAGEDPGNRNAHSLLMGMQNATVTLKDSLTVSAK